MAVIILLYLASVICAYTIYNCYAAEHIEVYLNKTSEEILFKSSNDTEIVQNIVNWELREFVLTSERFQIQDSILREISTKSGWYLFLNKGNCGEFGIVFEDMANRTGLTCRTVKIDGFIDFDGHTNNHAWSEVLINETEWVVADSGFNYYPPADHYLGYSQTRLLGPVYAFENGIQIEDRTTHYIPNTEKIILMSTRDGEAIPNCSIDVQMNNNEISQKVVGAVIKLKTNESGLCPVTLGVYDNTSYTVRMVDSKGIYQYEGEKDVILGNGTDEIKIEVDQPRPSVASAVFLLLIICTLCIWRSILRKRP
ncbi:hypothetical protein ES707_00716 [subsurface metagenome]